MLPSRRARLIASHLPPRFCPRRLQFELDRLVSGPMAFTRHDEEWQMLRAEVQELGQHGDISDRLTTLQRIMRSYSVFTV